MVEHPVRHRVRRNPRPDENNEATAATSEPSQGDAVRSNGTDAVNEDARATSASSTDGSDHLPPYALPPEADIYRDVIAEYLPRGIIEQTWCRDIARNIHHANRLRALREGYLQAARTSVVQNALRETVTYFDGLAWDGAITQNVHGMAALIKAGRNNAVQNGLEEKYDEVVSRLRAHGFELREIPSRAYFENMAKLDAIEKLIVVTDSRRDVLVRELDKRRSYEASYGAGVGLRRVGRSTL